MERRADRDSERAAPLAPPSPRGRGAGGEAPFTRGPGMTRRARALRTEMTEAERALWRRFRGDALGVRFRRQMPVLGRYILDFYCPSVKLAVEVDGGQHAESPNDPRRDAVLNAHGISVLRFWNHDVLREDAAVAEAIADVVAALRDASPPSPLRSGGGSREDLAARFDHLNICFAKAL